MARKASNSMSSRLTRFETIAGWLYLPFYLIILNLLLQLANEKLSLGMSALTINIAVKKRQGDMIFLRKIVPGAADDSYGIEVAKLAGIPDRVITRAREILKELESGAPETAKPAAGPVSDQVSMLDMQSDELRRALEAVTVETLTPIEAMNVLYQLKQLL